MRKRLSIEAILLGLLGFAVPVQAQVPIGLLGGVNDNGAYAAFLEDLTGNLTPISGLPTGNGSFIQSVSINGSGDGLLGGRNEFAGYASFVKADGTLIPLNVSNLNTGEITGVAINKGGLGLIGGISDSFGSTFLAYVAQDGTVTPVTQGTDYFNGIAISLNDSGVGLIGGEGGFDAYAAYVNPNGTVNQVAGTPINTHLTCVAINSAGNGIIGGLNNNLNGAYAAFVSPGRSASPVGPLPSGTNAIINSVAINNSGNGLIGGNDGTNAYAGFVQSYGAVTPLFNISFPGNIDSVALNDSNVGLIGGQIEGNLFAALRQSNGSVITLFSEAVAGNINSVAINQPGVGLIGGVAGSEAYAALVAPNGALTVLDVADPSSINSVSLRAMNDVVPTFITTYNAPLYSLFAASAALQNRFIWQNRVWMTTEDACCDPCRSCSSKEPVSAFKRDSVWLEPFGETIHANRRQLIPGFKSYIGGVLVGYDRQAADYILGVAAGYAFNRVNPEHHQGHVDLNQELLSVYGAYYNDYFWIASSIWGSVYQANQVRTPISLVKAKSHIYGCVVNPHVEVASPWSLDPCGLTYFEPFVAVDWANNWQRPFTERGDSGFNVNMPRVRNSILQTEAGLRFYERFLFGCGGQLCLEEKVSYVNHTPYQFNRVDTSFVESTALFPVEVGSKRVENFAAFQVLASYIPDGNCLPYGGFSFEATVGEFYQAYSVGLFCGYDF